MQHDDDDDDRLAGQMVRFWRAEQSQLELALTLGFKSNVVYHWESGRSGCLLSTALTMAERRTPGCVARLCEALNADWTERIEPTSRTGLALLLNDVLAGLQLPLIVRRTGLSRHKLGRWLRGDSEPTLPEFLAFLRATYMIWTVAPILAPGVPCTPQLPAGLSLDAQETFTGLMLPSYSALARHDPSWLAARVGHPHQEVEEHLAQLRALGLVTWTGTHWRIDANAPIYHITDYSLREAHLASRLTRQPPAYHNPYLVIASPAQMRRVRELTKHIRQEMYQIFATEPDEGELYWISFAIMPLANPNTEP